jgi:hypothetical protein
LISGTTGVFWLAQTRTPSWQYSCNIVVIICHPLLAVSNHPIPRQPGTDTLPAKNKRRTTLLTGTHWVTIMARRSSRTPRPTRPARRARKHAAPPPPHPVFSFTEPEPTGRDHLIRIWFDTHSKRWGFFESQVPFDPERDVPDNLKYQFDTVGDATIGALRHLELLWGDASILWIHGGVPVPDMPRNARITGSPGYRARIDAGLYEMDQAQLQAEHGRTIRRSDGQARQTAIVHDIPIGQQVHAFRELYERLWPRHRRHGAPKLNVWLDEMMPKVKKRKRERHFKTFAIVSSDDWPVILETTDIEITGMDSILTVARSFSPPRPRHKKVRTPLTKRYQELRFLLLARRYEDGRRRALEFDEEDDDDAPPGSYVADDEAPKPP